MLSVSLRLARAWVRAQGLPAAFGVVSGWVAMAWLIGRANLELPGLQPFPVFRVLPFLLAGAGAGVLLEPWRDAEATGVRSVWFLRGLRWAVAVVLVSVGSLAVAVLAHSEAVLPLALVALAVLVLAVTILGSAWWAAVPLGLYGQLYLAADLPSYSVDVGWVLGSLVATGSLYLVRGAGAIRR